MAAHASQIVVNRMPQQSRIMVTEDDWTGKTSSAERRKLQNRINQRSYRYRKRTNAAGDARTNTHNLRHPTGQESELWHLFQSIAGPAKLSPLDLPRASAACMYSAMELQKLISSFERWINSQNSPIGDHVVVLVKFNVFRALFTNSNVLGFIMHDCIEDNAISPFATSPIPTLETLPVGLHPTHLQRTTAHHPWLDLLPVPRMRDNLIRAGNDFDDMPLCGDLTGFLHPGTGSTALIVWRDPWDVSG
ncbi:hypothetical protein B0O99DRAFT_593069 [Bisporella sp. PMI_857]|nr:hypothetical protein B0O99DRAFT_593069 [Bisporella sp. PMI_857]